MESLVFGHAGQPILVFPTSRGRFFEYEDAGMIHALGGKLEGGAIQVFCVDSVDGESWYNKGAHPGARIGRHVQYERYVISEFLPYFYSLVGERNPKQPPATGPRSPYSPLACDAFEIIRRRGPISKTKLGEMLGGSVSNAGLDRGLSELWAKLRIARVEYTAEEGSVWDELSRWAPDVVREGVGISVPEALSAMVSKYLDCVVAVDEGEVENFLANFVPRTRVKEAIHALLSARELSFVHVGSKSLLQVTPPKQAYVPKNRRPERVS